MPDTLPNIPLPSNVWVDLYSESGISVGTQIIVQNVGRIAVQITTSAAQPAADTDAYKIIERESEAKNETGDSGAWARSQTSDGLINVKVA